MLPLPEDCECIRANLALARVLGRQALSQWLAVRRQQGDGAQAIRLTMDRLASAASGRRAQTAEAAHRRRLDDLDAARAARELEDQQRLEDAQIIMAAVTAAEETAAAAHRQYLRDAEELLEAIDRAETQLAHTAVQIHNVHVVRAGRANGDRPVEIVRDLVVPTQNADGEWDAATRMATDLYGNPDLPSHDNGNDVTHVDGYTTAADDDEDEDADTEDDAAAGPL